MNGISPHIYPIDSTAYLLSSVSEKSSFLVYEYNKLSDAVFCGNILACEACAKKIHDINVILCFYHCKTSHTLLHDAVRYGKKEIVNILLKNGACPDSPNKKGKTARMLAKKNDKVEIIELFQKYKPEIVKLKSLTMNQLENGDPDKNNEPCIIS